MVTWIIPLLKKIIKLLFLYNSRQIFIPSPCRGVHDDCLIDTVAAWTTLKILHMIIYIPL